MACVTAALFLDDLRRLSRERAATRPSLLVSVVSICWYSSDPVSLCRKHPTWWQFARCCSVTAAEEGRPIPTQGRPLLQGSSYLSYHGNLLRIGAGRAPGPAASVPGASRTPQWGLFLRRWGGGRFLEVSAPRSDLEGHSTWHLGTQGCSCQRDPMPSVFSAF